MTERDLKERTKQFALAIIRSIDKLPKSGAARTIANQVIRSATSVGANYRAACRGRSTAEFIAKLGIVVEEADEGVYWLELIADGGMMDLKIVEPVLREANEITAIMTASHRTAQRGRQSGNPKSKITNPK